MNAKLITGALASALTSLSCERVVPQTEGDKAPLRRKKRETIASFFCDQLFIELVRELKYEEEAHCFLTPACFEEDH